MNRRNQPGFLWAVRGVLFLVSRFWLGSSGLSLACLVDLVGCGLDAPALSRVLRAPGEYLGGGQERILSGEDLL